MPAGASSAATTTTTPQRSLGPPPLPPHTLPGFDERRPHGMASRRRAGSAPLRARDRSHEADVMRESLIADGRSAILEARLSHAASEREKLEAELGAERERLEAELARARAAERAAEAVVARVAVQANAAVEGAEEELQAERASMAHDLALVDAERNEIAEQLLDAQHALSLARRQRAASDARHLAAEEEWKQFVGDADDADAGGGLGRAARWTDEGDADDAGDGGGDLRFREPPRAEHDGVDTSAAALRAASYRGDAAHVRRVLDAIRANPELQRAVEDAAGVALPPARGRAGRGGGPLGCVRGVAAGLVVAGSVVLLVGAMAVSPVVVLLLAVGAKHACACWRRRRAAPAPAAEPAGPPPAVAAGANPVAYVGVPVNAN